MRQLRVRDATWCNLHQLAIFFDTVCLPARRFMEIHVASKVMLLPSLAEDHKVSQGQNLKETALAVGHFDLTGRATWKSPQNLHCTVGKRPRSWEKPLSERRPEPVWRDSRPKYGCASNRLPSECLPYPRLATTHVCVVTIVSCWEWVAWQLRLSVSAFNSRCPCVDVFLCGCVSVWEVYTRGTVKTTSVEFRIRYSLML